jgi:hypothetical protein
MFEREALDERREAEERREARKSVKLVEGSGSEGNAAEGLVDDSFDDESIGGINLRDIGQEVWVRGQWLLGLLVLQSASSFVIEANQQLIKDHLVITLFMTMLVGAGGNAGNQSAILVIRGLATKEIQVDHTCQQPRNVVSL